MTLLTVVVPTYNRRDYLEVCLASLRAQTAVDGWEAVVVDDGSTDGTAAMVETVCRSDGRFRSVSQANRGVAAARNAGARAARGPWIAFLDSDDLWFDNAIGAFLECMAALPANDGSPRIISGGFLTSFEKPAWPYGDSSRTCVDAFERVLGVSSSGRPLVLQSTLFHRDLVHRVGGFAESFRTCEDRDFMIRATAASDVAAFAEVAAYYRTDHGGGKSETALQSGAKIAAHRRIFGGLEDDPVVGTRLRLGDGGARLRRLIRSYQAMLDVADALRLDDEVRIRAAVGAFLSLCETEDELLALLRRLGLFFYYPLHAPGLAHMRRLAAFVNLLENTPIDHPARRTVAEQVDALAEANVPAVQYDVMTPSAAAGLYRAPPLSRTDLAAGRVLLRAGRHGGAVVDSAAAPVVQSLGRFRSLSDHVKLCVCHGLISPEAQSAAQAALHTALQSGVLMSPDPLLPKLTPAHRTSRLRHVALAVDAGTDGAFIPSLLGQLPEAVDPSAGLTVTLLNTGGDEGPAAALGRALDASVPGLRGNIRYIGLESCRRYAAALASEGAVAAKAAALATGDDHHWTRASLLLNALLLDTVGEEILLLEPSARAAPPYSRNSSSIVLTAHSSPPRTICDPSTAGARPAGDGTRDLFSAHARYLGASLSECLRGHDRVEVDEEAPDFLATGSGGEPFVAVSVSSCYRPALDRPWRDQLLRRTAVSRKRYLSDREFQDAWALTDGWWGVCVPTIARASSMEAGAVGLANYLDTLPPFLPCGRGGVDSIFGAVLRLSSDDARVAYLPEAVRLARSPSALAGTTPALLDAFSAAIALYQRPIWMTGFAQVITDLGRHLEGVAGEPGDALAQLVGSWAMTSAGAEIARLTELQVAYEGRPASWSEEISRRVEHLEDDIHARWRGGSANEERWADVRGALRAYGLVLQGWPQLTRAAMDLRGRGIRCSVPLE